MSSTQHCNKDVCIDFKMSIDLQFVLVDMCLDLIGLSGPIQIDTRIAKNSNCEDTKSDIFHVGSLGEKITGEDVKKFIWELRMYSSREEFNNYIASLEKIELQSDGSFVFMWDIHN
jgi:hypothetical protein